MMPTLPLFISIGINWRDQSNSLNLKYPMGVAFYESKYIDFQSDRKHP